ncbi:MAG: STAS domain-containing protein [Clostridia bacterium]|nr:STAS domain-containing protein [Clostridia bacterium]
MAKVTFKYEDGILLAVLSGEITLLESNDLKEKIKDELARLKTFKLVLDLSQVPLLDSSGLGMLIALFKHINQKEGAIIYVGITDYVKKIIGFAKLDKIFTIVDTLEEAMKILKQ